MITLLDYGAGNVLSVRNAIRKMGGEVVDVKKPEDIVTAKKLIFPGVGHFGVVMERLRRDGFIEPLIRRINENRPLLGICVALQTLFEGSEEAPGVAGLGLIPGIVKKFNDPQLSVPQIGWNGIKIIKTSDSLAGYSQQKLYFVHSYYGEIRDNNKDWILATSDYGCEFISAVESGNTTAFQFHPEKSGEAGLGLLANFIQNDFHRQSSSVKLTGHIGKTATAKRIVACLDVRANDEGDLVVTKGDQYDVRDSGQVRNLGLPVDLAKRYYEEGADEITFLNITGYRDFPMKDQPMLEVLKNTSENVFVPLTIGGGIQEFTDSDGKYYSALDVASAYFRSGADKVSIGSDAVYAAENFLKTGEKTGNSSIERISSVYGAQAVVISVDPRRVYEEVADASRKHIIETDSPGPNGEKYCWYQCTVKGGREARDIDVIDFVQACETLGAGEILLNSIDKDGSNSGFDIELINHVRAAVKIPVIASSGAGCPQHFVEVFQKTDVEAALAAGIFHRREVSIGAVKEAMTQKGLETR